MNEIIASLPFILHSSGKYIIMMALNPSIKHVENSTEDQKKLPETIDRKAKKRVRLKAARKAKNIFKENDLVDSPRQILLEKTTLGTDSPSPLFKSLESFYDEVAITSLSDRAAAERTARNLMSVLLPKCAKLGRGIGFRFTRAVLSGSTMDGTQVLDTKDVDVFLVFELPIKTVRVATLEPGYRMIPLRKFFNDDNRKYDPWQFGRSKDGLYLSPLIVNRNVYDLVVRALKYHQEAHLDPYTLKEGQAPIQITVDGHTVHITPAVFLHSEDTFLVTRPYRFDEHVTSDMMWRMSFVAKERKLMNTMSKTDRGMRKKAFIALKALIGVEHTLTGLDSYQIKTALFHCFDKDIDCTPRWQRNIVDNLFLDLVREIYHCFRIKQLPNFFIKDHNLLGNMDKKLLHDCTQRLCFIVNNPKELIRILRKRPGRTDEDLLPFDAVSRDSTTSYLSASTEFGTEVTLLNFDINSQISFDQTKSITLPSKRKTVRFNESTIIL